jgi:hypothetical protein
MTLKPAFFPDITPFSESGYSSFGFGYVGLEKCQRMALWSAEG